MVAEPGVPLTGQTSPCSSTYWNLHEAKSLVDAATDRSVVQGGLHKHALGIDDEETTVGVAGHFHQNVVLARNALGKISHERNLKGTTEATLLARGVDPRQMRVLGVDGHADHFSVDLAELVRAVAEGKDLSGAHEGKVERVEEKHQVLAIKVGELDAGEVLAEDGLLVKVGGGLTNNGVGGHCTRLGVECLCER